MNSKFLGHLILFCVIIPSECFNSNSVDGEYQQPDENAILAEGSSIFSSLIYKALMKEQNLFFSPVNLRVGLAALAEGSAGTTLKQMKEILALDKFQDQEQSARAFQTLVTSFSKIKHFQLYMANRIYVDHWYPIFMKFKDYVKTYFQNWAENVNFRTNPSGVTRKMNFFVLRKLQGWTNKVVRHKEVSKNTRLVLINAISFRGLWKISMDPALTIERDFNLADDRTIQVPTMYTKGDFKYTLDEASQCEFLQLPYDGDRFVMLLALPAQGTKLSSVVDNVDFTSMYDFMETFPLRLVELYLPKFQYTFRKDLRGALKLSGMKEIFHVLANFTRITSKNFLKVNHVVHQASIRVDEKGTVKAEPHFQSSLPEPHDPVTFRVDRPCIYYIYDLLFKQIMFIGHLDDPSQSSSKYIMSNVYFSMYDLNY